MYLKPILTVNEGGPCAPNAPLKWQVLLSCLTFLLLLSCEAIGDEPTAIKAKGVLGQGEHGHGVAMFKLGTLKTGSRYSIDAEVVNLSGSDLNQVQLKSSCGCMVASIAGNKDSIKAGETFHLNISLETPRSSKKIEQLTAVNVVDRSGSISVQSKFSYTLSGLLAFPIDEFVASYDPSRNREPKPFLIPLLITEPVEPSSLEASSNGNLEGAACEVVEVDGEPFIKVTVGKEKVLGGASGMIIVRDSKRNMSAQIPCVIKDVERIELSPRVMTARWSAEENAYVGKAILKLNRPEDAIDAFGKLNQLRLVMRSDEGRCSVRTSPIDTKNAIHRIDFKVSPDDLKDDQSELAELEVSWEINVKDANERKQSSLSLFPPFENKVSDPKE